MDLFVFAETIDLNKYRNLIISYSNCLEYNLKILIISKTVNQNSNEKRQSKDINTKKTYVVNFFNKDFKAGI